MPFSVSDDGTVTPEQREVLSRIVTVAAVISLLLQAFAIVSACLTRCVSRHYVLSEVSFAKIVNSFMLCMFMALGTEMRPSVWCDVQGFMLQLLAQASAVWSLILAVQCAGVALWERDFGRGLYYAMVLPLLCAIFPLVIADGYADTGLWCWISSKYKAVQHALLAFVAMTAIVGLCSSLIIQVYASQRGWHVHLLRKFWVCHIISLIAWAWIPASILQTLLAPGSSSFGVLVLACLMPLEGGVLAVVFMVTVVLPREDALVVPYYEDTAHRDSCQNGELTSTDDCADDTFSPPMEAPPKVVVEEAELSPSSSDAELNVSLSNHPATSMRGFPVSLSGRWSQSSVEAGPSGSFLSKLRSPSVSSRYTSTLPPVRTTSASPQRIPRDRSGKTQHASTWTGLQVALWVKSFASPQVYDAFRTHNVVGADLPDLDHEILTELGITKKLERARVLRNVAQLLKQPDMEIQRSSVQNGSSRNVPALSDHGRPESIFVDGDQGSARFDRSSPAEHSRDDRDQSDVMFPLEIGFSPGIRIRADTREDHTGRQQQAPAGHVTPAPGSGSGNEPQAHAGPTVSDVGAAVNTATRAKHGDGGSPIFAVHGR